MDYTTAVAFKAIPPAGPPDGHHRAEEANVSRVSCLECGIDVVVDPTGICPEGHLVGLAGVRVAGAMGSDVPHPDEPEPWVATVVLDEAAASPAAPERAIRPVQILGADAATEAERGEAGDHESMLRELHALGGDRDATPPSAVPQTGPSVQPTATAPVVETAPVAHVPPPPQEQVAEGFAELSALEAAFQALGYDEHGTYDTDQPNTPIANATPVPPPPADRPSPDSRTDVRTGSSDDLADLEGLFASPAPSSPSPSAPAPAPDRDEVASHAAAAPPVDPPDVASPPTSSAPPEPLPPDAVEAPRVEGAGLDITNFTARGGKVGSGRGGRRKLFGR